MSSNEPLLEVRDLSVEFRTDRGVVKAVNGLNYTIEEGEIVGFVGESGAGKTVTGLSVLDLIDSPGEIVGGEVLFRGEDVLSLPEPELRSFRGNEVSVVFQDSMTALNPAYTIGTQIGDVIMEHKGVSRSEAREQTIQLLEDVQIPSAESRIDEYPHQFSGGMRQRALIAMALSCDPSLVIADEITTALDVTTEAAILELLETLQEETGIAIQLITHDMGVIAEMADRVVVLYAGRLAEIGPAESVVQQPSHPYTQGLMDSIPRLDEERDMLVQIEGSMPRLSRIPSGCAFHPRCPRAWARCERERPELRRAGDGLAACLLYDQGNTAPVDVNREKRHGR